MATNPSVQRLSTGTPAFPDLHVEAFEFPPFPADIRARFPSLELWMETFRTAHQAWEHSLQSTLEKALQAQKQSP